MLADERLRSEAVYQRPLPLPLRPADCADENPCGAYIREFDLTESQAGMRQFLYFEGVDSCFYVW